MGYHRGMEDLVSEARDISMYFQEAHKTLVFISFLTYVQYMTFYFKVRRGELTFVL